MERGLIYGVYQPGRCIECIKKKEFLNRGRVEKVEYLLCVCKETGETTRKFSIARSVSCA